MKTILKTRFIALAFFLTFKSVSSFAQSDPILGQISIFAGNFAPQGWAFCNGQLLAISENTALYTILGTTYGGDGITTFALPDLRGRVIIGVGQGPGLRNYEWGEPGGSDTTKLAVANLPAHTHATPTVQVNARTTAAQVLIQGNSSVVTSGKASTATLNNTSVGNGQPINNMQPYLPLNFIIAIQGIFPSPSRN